MNPKEHWQEVYREKAPTGVSWYEPVPETSLALISASGLDPAAPMIDVGAGASTLVDHLLDAGFTDISVLDIAPAALTAARARLGARAAQVTWIETDILSFTASRRYALWHDRAVLHFMTDPADQQRYFTTLRTTLQALGHVILAAFGPEGPTRCSGLPVQRHSAASLGALLGPRFILRRSTMALHPTPGGQLQQFCYGWWQARD